MNETFGYCRGDKTSILKLLKRTVSQTMKNGVITRTSFQQHADQERRCFVATCLTERNLLWKMKGMRRSSAGIPRRYYYYLSGETRAVARVSTEDIHGFKSESVTKLTHVYKVMWWCGEIKHVAAVQLIRRATVIGFSKKASLKDAGVTAKSGRVWKVTRILWMRVVRDSPFSRNLLGKKLQYQLWIIYSRKVRNLYV